jgi:hypothetical protein
LTQCHVPCLTRWRVRTRSCKREVCTYVFLYTRLLCTYVWFKCTYRMARVEIRVPDVDLIAWKERASAAKLSLSDWIRFRCAENKAISDVLPATDVRTDARRESSAASVLERLPAVGQRTKPAKSTARTCAHGTAKGYNCWQCGGLANVQS